MTSTATFNTITKIIEGRKLGLSIPDVSMIMPGLYLGNEKAAKKAINNEYGGIVNCSTKNRFNFHEDNFNINYTECDVCFDGVLPSRIEGFITHHLSVGSNVLVYCETGMNLSAAVVIAYYMVVQAVDISAAIQHCLKMRPSILTMDFVVRKLIEFEQQKIIYELQQKAAHLEDELISAKRQIAVLTLDCDYAYLTIADYKAMKDKMSSDMIATGLTSAVNATKYLKICAKFDEMSRM